MNIPFPLSKWLTSLLPPRLALVPLLVEVIVCLLVLFACFFCLSICQYTFPRFCPCLLQKCTHYCIQHQFSSKFAVQSAQQQQQKRKQKEVRPTKHIFSQWKARQRMLARQTDFLCAPCFLPVQGIAFTLWVTTTCIYYICTCSQCQFVLWPLCPQSILLECCLMVVKLG